MKTTIFYYTGTGNTLWAARTLADKLGDAELVPIADWKPGVGRIDSKGIGLAFPVYIWGLPARVIRFLDELASMKPDYCFALAVNGGQVATTLVQLKKLLKRKGIALASGFDITMPSNYIPWGGPPAKEKQEALFSAAEKKLDTVAGIIRVRETHPVDKGPLWQNLLFSLLYKISFKQIPKMDKSFWVDEKCNACGTCARVCPSGNITLPEKKPVWNRHCEQCLACLQWCPQEAVQFGKKTPGYKRYHHPAIRLKDMLRTR
ncbi:MAG: EFR1 family ferrodoxin [Fibrobacterota bacterium]